MPARRVALHGDGTEGGRTENFRFHILRFEKKRGKGSSRDFGRKARVECRRRNCPTDILVKPNPPGGGLRSRLPLVFGSACIRASRALGPMRSDANLAARET